MDNFANGRLMLVCFGIFSMSLLVAVREIIDIVCTIRGNRELSAMRSAADYIKTIIVFERLTESAVVPTKAHENDAGYDFYAAEDAVIPAHGSARIKTGIAWEPKDPGCYMQIKARSGLAFKHGIECTSAGVIDSGYKGEIAGLLHNTTDEDYLIKAGERCFQGIVIRLSETNAYEGKIKRETDRGCGGFGSSGK